VITTVAGARCMSEAEICVEAAGGPCETLSRALTKWSVRSRRRPGLCSNQYQPMIAWPWPDELPPIGHSSRTVREAKGEGGPRDRAQMCRPVRRKHVAGDAARSAERAGGCIRRSFGLRHANGSNHEPGGEVLPDGTLTYRVRPRRHARAIHAACAEASFAAKTCASAPTPAARVSAIRRGTTAARAADTVMAPSSTCQAGSPHHPPVERTETANR
jgi:hypothetical protein